jgi:hypothetical protein
MRLRSRENSDKPVWLGRSGIAEDMGRLDVLVQQLMPCSTLARPLPQRFRSSMSAASAMMSGMNNLPFKLDRTVQR